MLVPSFPPGDIRSIYLHWTGSDYAAVFPAYHYCIALSPDGAPTVVETHDPRANMRDVRDGDAPYAAHTFGRNSYALGLAICGMGEARPDDFGRFPLRDNMIEACCELAAQASTAYRIAIDVESVRTHAEAALVDGYFGAINAGISPASLLRRKRSKPPMRCERANFYVRAFVRTVGERVTVRAVNCFSDKPIARGA